MYSTSLAASALLVASIAHAHTTHNVKTTDTLSFEPDTLENVAKGDKVQVTFSQGVPHNIVSGSWRSPCVYDNAGGLNSGIYEKGEVFTFEVNSTDSHVYFCSVSHHCQAGMALVINPKGNDTIKAYQEAATNTTSKGPSSKGPEGGVVQEGGNSNSSTKAGSTSTNGTSTISEPHSANTSKTAGNSTSGNSTTGSLTAQSTGAAAGLGPGSAMIAAIVAGGLAFAI